MRPPLDIESFRWDLLRDPEGGELCVFTRDEVPSYKLYEIVVDSADPAAIAQWWHGVLGGQLGGNEEKGWAWLDELPRAALRELRLRQGSRAQDGQEPHPLGRRRRPTSSALLDHGATVLREPDDDISWTSWPTLRATSSARSCATRHV